MVGTFICAVVLSSACLGATPEPADTRALRAEAVAQLSSSVAGARFFFLGIGIDRYQNDRTWSGLLTPIRDIQTVANVLQKRYLFAAEHTMFRLNEQASLRGIRDALRQLREQVLDHDSVVIYFAGHGYMDDDTGYWIPWDATEDSGSWLANHDIKRHLRKIASRHTLVISDSCFAGEIFARERGIAVVPSTAANPTLKRLFERTSRTALTSGGKEPVKDTGVNDEHSVFAHFLLQALRHNTKPFLLPAGPDCFGTIKDGLMLNARQTPEYGQVLDAGSARGSFVFFLNRTLCTDFTPADQAFALAESTILEEGEAEEAPPNSNCILVSSPRDGMLKVGGRTYRVEETPRVYVAQGRHPFALSIPGKPTIYGILTNHEVNEETRAAVFGMSDGILFPVKHINHVLGGGPVRYDIDLTTARGRRRVVSYVLSLNRIR
ncbi:MAG: caspase family protein [Lentisphaerae bacterium]|jgi:hypothetical protein|nr:caspase family protein [Lentisphaerota bacterium]MBT7058243.1 caspase family protein [Lentisphaerota bacterium]MBT7843960.1 caspase family protein [Lentisphaerota bacterium]